MLQQAHDLLAPVYDGFSEGFAVADLQQAKALLAQLTDGVT
jgi:predicted ATPase